MPHQDLRILEDVEQQAGVMLEISYICCCPQTSISYQKLSFTIPLSARKVYFAYTCNKLNFWPEGGSRNKL